MSGGGGGFGQAMVNSGMRMGGQAPAQGGAGYSAPSESSPYQPAFNSQQAPQQAPQQRSVSPLVQQQMMRQQGFNPMQQMMMRQQQPMFNPMQQQSSGLQAAMMQMMARQNQPMMRPQMQQMPQFRNPALGFRPDMTNAQQSLNRVQPSVYKTDLDTARARIAEYEAADAARASQDNSYNSMGG